MMTPEIEPLPQIIDRMRARLRGMIPSDPAANETYMSGFMADLFRLGLAVHRDPRLRNSPELVAFLNESADQLRHFTVHINRFIRVTQHKLEDSFEYDEWTWCCQRRSSLAFLQELC